MLLWLFEHLIGWPWCWHKWMTDEVVKVTSGPNDVVIGRRIYLRCERCGDWKRRQFS